MYKLTVAGVLATCLLATVACSGEDDAATDSKTAAPEQSSAQGDRAAKPGGPSVSISADKTHAVQPSDEITLTVTVGNFTLAAESIGGANQDGVGHYRVYLDNASGEDYLAAGADGTAKVTVPADITDGSHDLRVSLYNNDKSPLDPAVEASVLLIVYRL